MCLLYERERRGLGGEIRGWAKVRKVPRSLVIAFPARVCAHRCGVYTLVRSQTGKKKKKKKKESSKHVCSAQEAPGSSAESRPRTEFGQALTQKVNNTREKEGGKKGGEKKKARR